MNACLSWWLEKGQIRAPRCLEEAPQISEQLRGTLVTFPDLEQTMPTCMDST
eukprot:CAMPEP_0171060270 /NCGR_PEP_ID=MMETSP0766_2-20121228/3727_1 /TAXON_ID=439317 /ORGANISM="Gambierdiscus australes, Strain CAWD 149" /LENGTH=51 /DNA_ID=CAMNT_0011515823 /DNA_START=61 /DNA_END=212 /DNA_ORIENTATION=-